MKLKGEIHNMQLWQPTETHVESAEMTSFINFVNDNTSLNLKNYNELYAWSISHSKDFWASCWDYFDILYSSPYSEVCNDIKQMPGATWFNNAKLNFAENLLRYRNGNIAIKFYGENKVYRELSYSELFEEVEKFSLALRKMGVQKGDRVAGFLPNMPEAIIAMLATTSIGAIWSSSSPDFGIKGVLDRFTQIKPKVIIAADGYFFKGKVVNSLEKLKGIISELSSIENVVVVKYTVEGNIDDIPNASWWNDVSIKTNQKLDFEQLPFNHPLYIMYSSGTTGKPKSIVHSAGGTLIQHLKELILHTNLRENDSIFYFTTCGWMMWNWLVSSLSVGATVILYDGNPFYPTLERMLDIAIETKMNIFGTSAKYIASLENEGVIPSKLSDFPHLRTILSTGSPLSDDSFEYIYMKWKSDVQLSSISGGTDIISCFALGNPILPVYKGELQCRGLGMRVESYNSLGETIKNEKGELVCSQAFPSMPIYFWNDNDGEKYHNAYFSEFKNVWHHGDFISINQRGGIKIFGRSDATLNPGGVRIGTAEIYQVVENMTEIEDSVIIGHKIDDDEEVVLFIKLDDGQKLNNELINKIKFNIRSNCSPRHVPAKIFTAPDIPYTINGKKVELAVKRSIHGEDVTNKEALTNPESLDYFKSIKI